MLLYRLAVCGVQLSVHSAGRGDGDLRLDSETGVVTLSGSTAVDLVGGSDTTRVFSLVLSFSIQNQSTRHDCGKSVKTIDNKLMNRLYMN